MKCSYCGKENIAIDEAFPDGTWFRCYSCGTLFYSSEYKIVSELTNIQEEKQ